MSAQFNLTNLMRRQTLECCPLCGKELVYWKTEKFSLAEYHPPLQEQITTSICWNCKITLSLSITGHFTDSGEIKEANNFSINAKMASTAELDMCVLKNSFGENEPDIIKTHRTPKDIGLEDESDFRSG